MYSFQVRFKYVPSITFQVRSKYVRFKYVSEANACNSYLSESPSLYWRKQLFAYEIARYRKMIEFMVSEKEYV